MEMNELYTNLLKISIGLPFLMGLLMLVFQSPSRSLTKLLGMIGFGVPFLLAMVLAVQFGEVREWISGYAYYSDTNTGLTSLGISLKLGLNGVSVVMYVLAAVVGLAAGCYAVFTDTQRLGMYLGLLLVMFAGLMGTFASVDIFFFYFFHEFALIPTFIMIGVWGGRGRRLAAMEMTVYLTLGAMLSLIGLVALYFKSGLGSFDLISLRAYVAEQPIADAVQENIFALLMFGFGILVSLFPFHTWAPRGYGAAPTPVAMLHAGVLKKFGLYGLIQVAAPLLPEGAGYWVSLMAWLALGNIVIIGLITIAQKDLKQMIGYSSVMHMGYCFLGIATLGTIGLSAAIILMFAHGLSVALLFLLTTAVYRRAQTFEMEEMGGMIKEAPVLCCFFVAATMANIGLPGFANFWGELGVFVSLWEFSPWMVFVAVAGIVISAIYGLRAVARIFFGPKTEAFAQKKATVGDLDYHERLPALVLLTALMLIGLWPSLVAEPINITIEGIDPAELIAEEADSRGDN